MANETRFQRYAVTVKLGATLWLDHTRIVNGQLDEELKRTALNAIAQDILEGWIDSNVTEWVSVLPAASSFDDDITFQSPWTGADT